MSPRYTLVQMHMQHGTNVGLTRFEITITAKTFFDAKTYICSNGYMHRRNTGMTGCWGFCLPCLVAVLNATAATLKTKSQLHTSTLILNPEP